MNFAYQAVTFVVVTIIGFGVTTGLNVFVLGRSVVFRVVHFLVVVVVGCLVVAGAAHFMVNLGTAAHFPPVRQEKLTALFSRHLSE